MIKLFTFIVLLTSLDNSWARKRSPNCPYGLKWEMKKAGTLNTQGILGPTDFIFLDKETILTANFPPEGNESAPLQIYRFSKDIWSFDAKASEKLPYTQHARQLILEDLDGDKIQEIIIADHGTDKPPFNGAKPVILRHRNGSWLPDTTVRSIKPAFTFNTAVIDLDKNKKGLYFANVSSGTPIVLSQNRENWIDVSHLLPKELGTKLCLMTTVKADFDGDGVGELFLGGCDRPESQESQRHDRILSRSFSKSWNLLPPETLPPRKRDSKWGTVFASVVDLDADRKPDILVATHDYGFHEWEVVGYLNRSEPGKFKFSELVMPVRQEKDTEGFVYKIHDFDVTGTKAFLIQVRSVLRDKNKRNPTYSTRLMLREGKSFVDASQCLPQNLTKDLVHVQTYPDSSNKLLVISFSGEMQTLTLSR